MNPGRRPQRQAATLAALLAAALGAAASAAEYVDPVAYVRVRSTGHTGAVNALAFSPDGRELYSAGNDKAVRVWRSPQEPGDAWSRSPALRWEVGYGVPGRVYALDADPSTGVVAVGGRGGRGLSGEVIWFDPARPKSFRSWRFPADDAPPSTPQHEQVVRSLAFSPDGGWFASADLDGQVLLWRGAPRQPLGELLPPVRRVNARDEKLWRPTGWEPRWRPLAWAGERTLVYPRLVKKDLYTTPGGVVPLWRAFTHDPVTGDTAELGDGSVVYPGLIMAIAASRDGRRVAVAGVNRAYVYQRGDDGGFTASPLEAAIAPGVTIRSLAFTPDGARLLVGREAPGGGVAELIELDGGPPYAKRYSWTTSASVEACATGTDGDRIAYAAGNDIFVVDLAGDQAGTPVRLEGAPTVERVAFLKEADDAATRLLIRGGGVSRIVDPAGETTVQTLNGATAPATAPPGREARGWAFDPTSLTVRRNGRANKPLPIDTAVDGGVRAEAWCWAPDSQGTPAAIAVGAETSGSIFVFDVTAPDGAPRLVRKFVGHEGAIASLAAHADGKLLASSADDGTAALWSLADLSDKGGSLYSVWGVRLTPHADGGSRVAEVATQGPFFNRGVRVGDRVARIRWREGGPLVEATDHASIVSRLEAITPADTSAAPMLEIVPGDAERRGEPLGLSFAPIWSPLLSIYGVGDAWIAWTPTGHYDASIGGDRLIGWHFNGSPGEAPSFATAQQHHRKFRRPELIRQLLSANDAAEAAAVEQVLQKHTVDNKQLPDVRVTDQAVKADGSLTVSVEVDAPKGETVDEVALIDDEGRKVDHVEGPFKPGDKVDLTLEPVDGAEQVVTARVYGSSGTADAGDTVRYKPEPTVAEALNRLPAAKEVLYLVSIGVSEYDADVDVGRLRFAAADAEHVAAVFKDHPAYDRVEERVLTTRDETSGERLREALRWLRDAADGNDTIALFFAGHSRVEGSDVRLLPSDGDTTGLASAELVQECFDRSRGRKVLILDSCNSGRFREAINSSARRSDDADIGVSLFAACADDEQAREDHENETGVFTGLVVRGLDGAASRRGSAVVSDTDLAGFLRQDQDAVERFSVSMQEPVLYIPFAFERKTELRLTRVRR